MASYKRGYNTITRSNTFNMHLYYWFRERSPKNPKEVNDFLINQMMKVFDYLSKDVRSTYSRNLNLKKLCEELKDDTSHNHIPNQWLSYSPTDYIEYTKTIGIHEHLLNWFNTKGRIFMDEKYNEFLVYSLLFTLTHYSENFKKEKVDPNWRSDEKLVENIGSLYIEFYIKNCIAQGI